MNTNIIKLISALLALISLLGCCGCGSDNVNRIQDSTTEAVVETEPTDNKGGNVSLEAMRPEHGAAADGDVTDAPETSEPEAETPETSEPEAETPETSEPEAETPETSEPEAELPEEPTLTEDDKFVPYNVPLTIDQQKLVAEIAKSFDLDPALVFGVMCVETKYDMCAVGKNKKYLGIMQVALSNLKVLNSRLGITDLMDFEQNVTSGCFFIRYNMDAYDSRVSVCLLYYHGGPKYANKMLSKGKTEDSYTKAVMKEMNRIISEREILAQCLGVKLDG